MASTSQRSPWMPGMEKWVCVYKGHVYTGEECNHTVSSSSESYLKRGNTGCFLDTFSQRGTEASWGESRLSGTLGSRNWKCL